jgi:hypothetical protein
MACLTRLGSMRSCSLTRCGAHFGPSSRHESGEIHGGGHRSRSRSHPTSGRHIRIRQRAGTRVPEDPRREIPTGRRISGFPYPGVAAPRRSLVA